MDRWIDRWIHRYIYIYINIFTTHPSQHFHSLAFGGATFDPAAMEEGLSDGEFQDIEFKVCPISLMDYRS